MKKYMIIATLVFIASIASLLFFTWLTQSPIFAGLIVVSILFSSIIALIIRIKDEIISYIDYISARGKQ